jgi:hypothetical protein
VAWNPYRGSATAPGRGNNDHLAEQCRDSLCPRLPCRMWKDGYRVGYDKGWEEGYAAGFGAGYSAGYGAGYAAGVATCSG